MRYGLFFSTVVAIVGVVLVSGSLLMVPYTVMEPVRVDKSKTWVDDTFVLMPFKNRTYELDSVAKNLSIFLIQINHSDAMAFEVAQEYKERVVFPVQIGSGGGDLGAVLFWTPPFDSIWLFIFENPYSTAVNVSATVTEFYLKATEEREATYYRSLFDPFYGYSGIVAIIVAIGLNIIHLIREVKRRN